MSGALPRAAALVLLLLLASAGYRLAGAGFPVSSGLGGQGSNTVAPGPVLPDPPVATAAGGDPEDVAALLDRFEAGLASRPRDPAALRQLAAEISDADPRRGVSAWEALVDAYADDAGAHVGLAGAYLGTGDLTAAERLARRAVEIAPHSAEAHLMLGQVLAGSRPPRLREALAEWKRAVELGDATPASAEAAELIRLYEGR